MPLYPGKSKANFKHNVVAEIRAGKPQKQAVAIAYSEQRKSKGAKGMNKGGEAEMKEDTNDVCPTCGYAKGGDVKPSPTPEPSPSPISEKEAEKFRKGAGFSEGGLVDKKKARMQKIFNKKM